MAVPNASLIQTICTVFEALSCGECRNLSYLCGSLDPDSSDTDVKEMLKSKVTESEMGKLFLTELVAELGRFDLLRRVIGISRDEVERTLRHRRSLPRFKVLMVRVSEDMTSEDIESVKFLLSSMLPREKTRNAKHFLDLVIELEKLDKISPERVDFIEQCLRNIGRIDLVKKVHAYRMSGENQQPSREGQQQPSQQVIQQPRPLRTSASLSAPNNSHSWQQRSQGQYYQIASGGRSRPAGSTPVRVNRAANSQCALDMYQLNPVCRGVCVIVDCVGNDGDMLEALFKALLFHVILHKWLNVDNIESALRGVARQRELHEAGALVCCIISRGTPTNILGTDSQHTGLRLDRLRRFFSAEECPMLAGKPKLFFLQGYHIPKVQVNTRSFHRDEDLEADGFCGPPECELIPTDADVFWSHCWTDECQLQQSSHHSVYLRALTDSLQRGRGRNTHLVDAHLEVNAAIYDHNTRNPGALYQIDLKHTLRKNLFLT